MADDSWERLAAADLESWLRDRRGVDADEFRAEVDRLSIAYLRGSGWTGGFLTGQQQAAVDGVHTAADRVARRWFRGWTAVPPASTVSG